MAENWVYNLDMLAQNGVINYDAASFIKGQPPRFVGNPTNPPDANPAVFDEVPKAPLMSQPDVDEFNKQNSQEKKDGLVKLPLWKKLAFSALLACGLGFGAFKYFKK